MPSKPPRFASGRSLRRLVRNSVITVLVASALPVASATAENTAAGYWKLDRSPTSAVIRVLEPGLVGGELPPPIWGWTPQFKGYVSRPASCYKQAGALSWVIGFGGGGVFKHYIAGTNCASSDLLTSRWFLRGANGLRQNYVLDPDGISGPTPGRQIRFDWYRTQPAVSLGKPSYDGSKQRLTLRWRNEAVYGIAIELRHDGKRVYSSNLPWQDGSRALTVGKSVSPDNNYKVSVTARSGLTYRLTRSIRFAIKENGDIVT